MRLVCRTLSVVLAALTVSAAAARAQDDRGRPVVLLVHGRGMLDRDTAATRKLWLDGLMSGAKTLAEDSLLTRRDVRVVWYADVLDPRSNSGCDYSAADPRAKRSRGDSDDAQLRSFVGAVGGFLNVLTSMVSDSASGSELRALGADAAFLSDPRKRCAAEDRLAQALSRAKSEGRPVILVAHSLGSVVAYDYLSAIPDSGVVTKLITIGSPVGSADFRRLLIGGDSTITRPMSVLDWVNVRNDTDLFAVPLSVGRDVVSMPPPDETDPHEMVGYLRESATAREVLIGWCGAFRTRRPQGCNGVIAK